MGVPKFFRYISERYPCLSEFVKEYQIPSFDNLYLDMNGIIHMCSHPDDNNPHFRITEEKIFSDIFHYIEVLFRMIKPQKVFFMAVDGVAPRAKMNQQRGRRFRSAKEAEKLERDAMKKGETLPEGARFDSNCITPGTEFMAKLHEQLKYFVVQKISTDQMWKKCKVILSGQETPGEGEHKIMDYIRYIRSEPGYDPNTRHCLYGLDADLIMLGLCTHDPHFSLLREEVKFGRKAKRSNVPEEIRFYLLHLSLMREYLELEFAVLKEKLANLDQPKFDIEKIIDDWILMGFLVGNDFIPNLPNLHISNGALPVLYQAYIEVLPTLDGYINEAGTLNLERFEKFMKKLADIDFKNFEETQEDLLYFEKKTGHKQPFHTAVNSKPAKIEDTSCVEKPTNPDLAALIAATDELDVSSDEEDSDKVSSSNEDEAFKSFKDEYYRNKLEYQKVTPEVMREQAEGYVRAIQWNLNYYYNGVCSWSWFYPHHYSPYISDIKNFSNFKIEFELGTPFKPYEQLLAVLPAASKSLLPKPYHQLMTNESSLIKSYYPEEFQTDLNGKRQEWEAVVLVPFIDEKVLLDAMQPCNEALTVEEVKRNQHGPMLIYEYTDEDQGFYRAPEYFPVVRNQSRCTPLKIEDIRVPQEKLVKGRYPGALFDVYYPGFPTLKHLKFKSQLKKARVKVFEQPSRNENMILTLLPNELYFNNSLPLDLLGSIIWVDWPNLVEAKVVALSNRKEKYVVSESENQGYKIEEQKLFDSELEGVAHKYRECMGIEFGKTDILVHVQLVIGRKYCFTSGTRVNLEKQFSSISSTYPLQSVVVNINTHDDCQTTFTDITDIFPVGSACFSLTHPHYGSQGAVMNSTDSLKNNQLKILLHVVDEPDFITAQNIVERTRNNYFTLNNAAGRLAISNYVFSRITGSLFIFTRNNEGLLKSVNIGLDLKFNKKNQETPGYTKKLENTWLYTNKAVDLVRTYVEQYPEVFNYLTNSNDDDIMADAIFNDESEEKVKSIQTWLKTLPTHNIERRVCGSLVLEPEVVAVIEKTLDEMQEISKDIIMQIKPHLLYKPNLQMGNLPPDPLATTTVFDRVVNVREGFTVPLGLKGTVIAIHKSSNLLTNDDQLYDIVFDKPFTGGMALNCSEHRGYRLPKTSFINLSHGKRHMEKKTGVPGALRALAKERCTVNSYNTASSVNNGTITARQQNSAFASFNKANNSTAYTKKPQNNSPQGRIKSNPPINVTIDLPKEKNSFYYMSDFSRSYDPSHAVNLANKKNAVVSSQPVTKEPTETAQKPTQPKPKTEVNTDFLKRILNINNSSNATGNPSSSQPSETARNFATTSANKEQNANFSSASARLLSFYQSNLLGCPRYTYIENADGFSAQVALPNGKVISGKTAKTREEASENVAWAALNMLKNKSKSSKEGLPSQFPVPPTKWVQERPLQNKIPSQVFQHKSYQNRPHQQMPVNLIDFNKKDIGPNMNGSYSNPQQSAKDTSNSNTHNFVPLQALKKRPQNQSARKEKTDQAKSATQTAAHSKEHGGATRRRDDNSGKPRKTRIAANFQK